MGAVIIFTKMKLSLAFLLLVGTGSAMKGHGGPGKGKPWGKPGMSKPWGKPHGGPHQRPVSTDDSSEEAEKKPWGKPAGKPWGKPGMKPWGKPGHVGKPDEES